MPLADVVPYVGEKVCYVLVIIVQRGAYRISALFICNFHMLFNSDKFSRTLMAAGVIDKTLFLCSLSLFFNDLQPKRRHRLC